MNHVRQFFLLLIALGLSTPAFAESEVYVPNQRGGWKVGLDVLYLLPTTSDLIYATKINPAFPFTSPDDILQNAIISPSYHWGLYAQMGYLFPCTGNDLTLGYTYLPNNESTNSIAADPIASFVAVLPFNGVVARSAFSFVKGEAKFNLNAVDLEGGQRFMTDIYDMRMFAGLRYANIDHTLQSFMDAIDFNSTTTANQKFESQFRGLGPRIGVDARYGLSSNLSIDANVSSALLIGQVEASYTANFFPEIGEIRHLQTKNDHNRVVPVLEAKVGIDYAYITDSCCNSSLVFEFGYQLTNYFNAIERAQVVNLNNPNIVFPNTTNDIGFDGFYLGVKYYA